MTTHIKSAQRKAIWEEHIKVAAMPKQPIPRSIAAPGLLSHVLVSKFEDHLPLHRQENILQRMGIDIPRATMSLWVIRVAELSQVEEETKHFSPPQRYEIRLQKARPILEKLYAYLLEMRPRVPPKNVLGEAITYTLNQWQKLICYLQDGRLENNNNRSERAIKPFAMGRKGWLFANSIAGAKAAATLYSLIETCKHHNIEPYFWFKYVLQQLPLRSKNEDISDLLPFNIDPLLLKN